VAQEEGASPVRLDAMNLRILNLLMKDAKMPTAEIARRLRRAETTVRERVYAMERAGVIRGYTAVVDKKALGYPSEAFVFGNVSPEIGDAVLDRLAEMKEVLAVYLVSGKRRLLLKVAAESNVSLRHFVQNKLIPLGVTDVDSHIVMHEIPKFPPDAVVEDAP
jgi:Lrp/AsnC family transcriptional regulator for asnA, asnC and gidA